MVIQPTSRYRILYNTYTLHVADNYCSDNHPTYVFKLSKKGVTYSALTTEVLGVCLLVLINVGLFGVIYPVPANRVGVL